MSNFASSRGQSGSKMPVSGSRTGILVETLIQILVLGVLGYAWWICTFHVGFGWLMFRHESSVYSVVYISIVTNLLLWLTRLYIHLSLGRSMHSVAWYPPPDKDTVSEPYVCINAEGDIAFCMKGNCRGKWVPPRAHHCSTCGVCRLDFDHHCPWIGNCVTSYSLKAFLYLLLLVPITFTFAVWPFAHILLDHIDAALYASHTTRWVNEIWWDRAASWILVAGPPGRWIVGTILGYVVLGQERARTASLLKYTPLPGDLIEEPHLRIALIAGFAFLISGFCIGLALFTTRRILRGVTTYEGLTASSQRTKDMHIKYLDGANNIVTTPILPGERIYDLGASANWKRFWERAAFDTSVPR